MLATPSLFLDVSKPWKHTCVGMHKTVQELKDALNPLIEKDKYAVSWVVKQLLEHPDFKLATSLQRVKLFKANIKDLGLEEGTNYFKAMEQLESIAPNLGLLPCPLEATVQMLLQDEKQQLLKRARERMLPFMKPVECTFEQVRDQESCGTFLLGFSNGSLNGYDWISSWRQGGLDSSDEIIFALPD